MRGKLPLPQSNDPDSTTTPPSEVPWPPRNFVAECTTMSAPHSIGRHRYGVATVESTTSGMPACVGDRGETLEVGDDARGVGDDFGVDQLRVAVGWRRRSRPARSPATNVVVDTEAGERALEQRARAAVQLGRRHDVIAGFAQRGDGQELGGLPAGGRDRADATFEAGHALLERGDGRIADAAVDVAELL